MVHFLHLKNFLSVGAPQVRSYVKHIVKLRLTRSNKFKSVEHALT